jgi:hypothetical protein
MLLLLALLLVLDMLERLLLLEFGRSVDCPDVMDFRFLLFVCEAGNSLGMSVTNLAGI